MRRVAIDVDDVLFPCFPRFVQFHNRQYGTHHTINDLTSYDLVNVFGGSRQEIMQKFDEFFLEHCETEVLPLPGAVDALKRLSREFGCVVITSRVLWLRPWTMLWLERHFSGIFQDVFFSITPGKSPVVSSKVTFCKTHDIAVLVDDHLGHAHECATAGIHGLVFGNYPWNQGMPSHSRLRRVHTWEEVCAALLGEELKCSIVHPHTNV